MVNGKKMVNGNLTRAWFPRIKRVLHTGVFPTKTSTCSFLFAVRVENELQEIAGYVATDKM